MITVSGLGVFAGGKPLFQDATFRIHPGRRYGLVGANGSGKSTLLRLITGEGRAEEGSLTLSPSLKLGFLKQDQFRYENVRIIDTVLMGNIPLWEALEEKKKLFQQLGDRTPTEKEGHRIAEIEHLIAHYDGYNAEAKAGEILEGLGIPAFNHTKPLSFLSGGYKLRVLLAQCLFGEPDILLLDEPTNHLDIISIHWLENYLREYRGALLVVSHDQFFLNRVATDILDIDYETIRHYKGNYDAFLAQKELESEQKENEREKQEKKKKEMEQFITRFKAKASKARQANSKAKQIEKMEEIVIKRSSRISPKFRFSQKRPTGKIPLRVTSLYKSFGDKPVLKDVNFTLERGEKLAVIGANGVGKSTLLQALLGRFDDIPEGAVRWGHETDIGYFAQDYHEAVKKGTTVFEWLSARAPEETVGSVRGMLGRVLLSGDDVKKKTDILSGGEAARLIFARFMFEKHNVLMLDEPTNHLDIETLDALIKALKEYPGTLLVVSHDRHFVQEVATSILEITPEGTKLFKGSYKEFLEEQGEDYLQRFTASHTASLKKQKQSQPQKTEKRILSQEEKKELRDLEKALNRTERKIATIDGKLQKIEKELYDGELYQPEQAEKLKEILKRKKEHELNHAEQMQIWEELVEKIEDLEKQEK